MKKGRPVVSRTIAFCFICFLLPFQSLFAQEVEHGYAQSGDVRIHYVTAGEGPLLIMIHGFPDYWYSWRHQIPELAKNFKVVAIDQRGYNLSDQPEGVENYTLALLAEDIQNVIAHFGEEKAVIVGHDWGGYVAWTCAMRYPQSVERLVVLNAPHPGGMMRELANNPEQQENSQYARDFQQPDAASRVTAEQLAGWVTDDEAREKYVEAFNRSSFEGMLNYYKANYPKSAPDDSGDAPAAPPAAMFPKIQCRVLMIHGLDDTALMPAMLNNSWEFMEKDLTIVTVPGAGHFVQQDAADLVTDRISNWLR
ncbi:MAG: alpha/beta hydrolase [Planctomycetota bacterium]